MDLKTLVLDRKQEEIYFEAIILFMVLKRANRTPAVTVLELGGMLYTNPMVILI